jgi:hypothetical protein
MHILRGSERCFVKYYFLFPYACKVTEEFEKIRSSGSGFVSVFRLAAKSVSAFSKPLAVQP